MSLFETAKHLKHGLTRSIDVKNRNVRVIGLMATDLCKSRCRHCFIWNKKEHSHLSVDVIGRLVRDPAVTRKTFFELTGGEFLEHPDWREIIKLVKDAGNDFVVLSNGMYPDELIEAVKELEIPNVYMSLDGLGETYKRVRGVDCSDNILRIVDEIKDLTNIHLGYTITPWNAVEDLEQVKALAEEKGVEMSVGAYQSPEFFDTVKPVDKISPEYEPYLDEFMSLNNTWMDKNLSIPCWNIRTKCYILGTGDVFLCQQKSVVLGNLNEKSFNEIWNSPETIATHEEYAACNDCWLACNRPLDMQLAYAGRLVFSNNRLNKMFGEHDWDLVLDAYRNHNSSPGS
jgi:MoaA/NifB/PqqE/SkfB family radical SAM enzyme